ncbi:MAG: hypothetical protein WCG45_06400 [bacterium]
MISSTGENLSILISCDYSINQNWMTFLSWYSLYKNLPDAKVYVICDRNSMNSLIFEWTKKCGIYFEIVKPMSLEEKVNHLIKKGFGESLVVINSSTLAIRDFEEADFDPNELYQKVSYMSESLCCDAKDNKYCVFADYSKGWGKFVPELWINKINSPFSNENKYALGDLTINEIRIGKLWNSVAHLFRTLSKG